MSNYDGGTPINHRTSGVDVNAMRSGADAGHSHIQRDALPVRTRRGRGSNLSAGGVEHGRDDRASVMGRTRRTRDGERDEGDDG